MINKYKDKKGVTLLELMITLAIIGITLVIAIPAYLSYMPHLRLRASARDIASCLNAARMKAISKNVSCTLTFNDANDTFTNDFGDSTYTSNSRDWLGKIDIWQGSAGAKYNAQPYVTDGKVTYNSYGTPSNLSDVNTDYAVYLKAIPFNTGGEEYRVRINRLTGKVTVEHWGTTSWNE